MRKMIKKFSFLLIAFCITSAQVYALQCGVSCVVFESNSIQKNISPKKEMAKNDHSCCHGEKEEKSTEKKPSCLERLALSCEYSLASAQLSVESDDHLSKIQFKYINAIFNNLDQYIVLNQRYRPKIPDAINSKSEKLLSLYVLKNQFLI